MTKLRSASDDFSPDGKMLKGDIQQKMLSFAEVFNQSYLAQQGAEKLWNLINTEDFVNALEH